MAGTLFVVATPIGNLEDITARALRVLREVSLIAAEDTRRTAHLLAHYGISTPTTSLHEHNERHKSASLLDRLQRGESIALVSDAGTPTISDPGQQLIRQALDAAVRVEPIPGPSAPVALLSASGFPSDTFTFLGFPPTRTKDRKIWFERLLNASGTVVFFESPHRVRKTLGQILSEVGDCPIAVGRELTKVHEELVIGPITMALEKLGNPIGEFVIALEVGDKTKNTPVRVPEASIVVDEFRLMTENGRAHRRGAITELAKKHGLSARAVYKMVEDAKKSGV